MKRFIIIDLSVALLAGFWERRSWIGSVADLEINGEKTVAERVQQYEGAVTARLQPDFAKAGVTYPPAKVTLVILKQERQVELYAENPVPQGTSSSYRFIRSYPILAASGKLGPKLHEGDDQVPEGIYAVESLNPNSHYHLALHVDYPNAFDRAHAQADGRTQLGGDIMIHGDHVSIGCVAMGDPAAEDLFILAAKTGLPNVRLLFCPFDFRMTKAALKTGSGTDIPAWASQLYTELETNLMALPLPPTASKP